MKDLIKAIKIIKIINKFKNNLKHNKIKLIHLNIKEVDKRLFIIYKKHKNDLELTSFTIHNDTFRYNSLENIECTLADLIASAVEEVM